MIRAISRLHHCLATLILLCGIFPACGIAQQYTLNASLSASDGAGLSVGDSVTLTLHVTNAGPSGGAGQAAVSIPDVFQFNGETGCNQSSVLPAAGGSFEFDWNSIPDTGGQLAPLQSVDCTILLTLLSTPPGPVSAYATIAPTTFDPTPGGDSHQFNFASAAVPTTDLQLTATANVSTLSQGQSVTLHLVAKNLGVEDAPNAVVAIIPPSQLQITSSTCNATQGSWSLDTLTAGASESCDLVLKASSASAQPVAVASSISSDAIETNPEDNSATVNLTIKSIAQVDVGVTLGAPRALTYALGDSVTVTLGVSATSSVQTPTVATAIVHLPVQGLITGLTASCGQFDGSGTTLTWSVTSLVPGQTQTCQINGFIASVTNPIPVSADVTSEQADTNLSNNTASLILQTYEPPSALIVTTQDSAHAALSLDGSVAVFESKQTSLVGNDINPNGQDIFRVIDGQPVRENIDSGGRQLVGTSSLPAISADGQVVAFLYSSTTPAAASPQSASAPSAVGDQGSVVAGPSGTSKHQVDTGLSGAPPNGPSKAASISADGHTLVFCSSASNLVPGDTNNRQDVFLVDPLNSSVATRRVSTDSSGAQLSGDSCEPKISANGKTVVFTTSAPSLFGVVARQVVRKDLNSGVLELVSQSTTAAGRGGSADSLQPSVNASGNAVAFVSKAADLDALGPAGGGAEVFVSTAANSNVGSPRTVARARNSNAAAPNAISQNPAISCDGSTVVFQSSATNLVTGTNSGSQGLYAFSPAASQVKKTGYAGQASNNNPAISCDGKSVGFDSNQPQTNSTTNNLNVFSQSTPLLSLDGNFSGQWNDPTQVLPGRPGHGLVLDVIDSGSNRALVATWFVFQGGQPTWVQGLGNPEPGTGSDAGTIMVKMDAYIGTGKSFPLNAPNGTFQKWGTITLKFANTSTGTMSWTSSYPGFNSGAMQINHFLTPDLPIVDPPGANVRACQSGNWFNPAQPGHGFEFNVSTQGGKRLLVADWFAFDPNGKALWLAGVGEIGTSNSVQATLYLINGPGAQFPPLFKDAGLTYPPPAWGTATFTFSDAAHAQVAWASTVAGYGSGRQPLQPLLSLVGRSCN